MTTITALWSFVLVVGLLTLTPGVDTALILRTATVQSARSAWGVVLGIQTGTLAWGILASAGITALLTASQLAYDVLRWAGACYLVWIGARMLWSTRPHPTGPDPTAGTPDPRRADQTAAALIPADDDHVPGGPNPPWSDHAASAQHPRGAGAADSPDRDGAGFGRGWRRGLLTNLLNPKMGAFYVALLPQFIPAGAPPLLYGILLAGVHVVLGLLWSTVLVTAARRLRDVLRRPRARRILDRVTGLVIVGFGVRLATEAR